MANDLAEVTDRVELDLRDDSNTIWTTAQLTGHIRHALTVLSQQVPQRLAKVVACTATREYVISTAIGAALEISDVWYPWVALAPTYPPPRVPWEIINGTLYLRTDQMPTATETFRAFYTLPHTLKDLDGASVTSFDAQFKQAVVTLATAYAAESYAAGTINTVTASGWTPRQLADWSANRKALADAEIQALITREIRLQDTRTYWDLTDYATLEDVTLQ